MFPRRSALFRDRQSGLEAFLVETLGQERDRCERELAEAGVHLPLVHRSTWARQIGGSTSWFLGVRGPDGRCRGGFAIEVHPSRALPGHRLLDVGHFGAGLPGDTLRVGVAGLAALAKRRLRTLRVDVNVCSREARGAIGDALAGAGFREVRPPRSYRHTLVIDLRGDLEAVNTALHKTARRNIRDIQKGPVTIRTITEVLWAPRIEVLQNLALQRTGAEERKIDWAARIELSRLHPELSCFQGLFLTGAEGPESLAAFAWGVHNGDHSEYRAGGSARIPSSRLSLAYGLLWELIAWSKANGATWFDLGGVTIPDGAQGEDALQGISDFKRYFSREVAEVGSEWQLEPRPLRARLAHEVGTLAEWVRKRVADARA